MAVRVLGEAELGEDATGVGLDGLLRDGHRGGDSAVGAPFGDETQDLALSGRQTVELLVATSAEQDLDHLGIDGGTARGHPTDRLAELAGVEDSVLEEVTDAAGAAGEQVEGVPRLDVVGQDEQAERSAVLGTQRLGGLQ